MVNKRRETEVGSPKAELLLFTVGVVVSSLLLGADLGALAMLRKKRLKINFPYARCCKECLNNYAGIAVVGVELDTVV